MLGSAATVLFRLSVVGLYGSLGLLVSWFALRQRDEPHASARPVSHPLETGRSGSRPHSSHEAS